MIDTIQRTLGIFWKSPWHLVAAKIFTDYTLNYAAQDSASVYNHLNIFDRCTSPANEAALRNALPTNNEYQHFTNNAHKRIHAFKLLTSTFSDALNFMYMFSCQN